MSKPSDNDILNVMNKTRGYFEPSEIGDRFNDSINNYDDYIRERLKELINLGYVTNQPTQTEKGIYTGYVITKAGIEHINKISK